MDQLLRWSVVRCSTRLDLFKIRVTLIGLRPTAVILRAERRIAAVSIQLLLSPRRFLIVVPAQ
jgi:hypothetical protein